MQIDTLCQHLCSYDDIIVVFPFSLVVGINIRFYLLFLFIAVGCRDDEWSVFFGLDSLTQSFHRVNGFSEDDKLAGGVLLRVEQLRFKTFLKSIEFRVFRINTPAIEEIFHDLVVLLQQLDVLRFEVFALVFGILPPVITPLLVESLYFRTDILYAISESDGLATLPGFSFKVKFLVDIYLWANEYRIVIPHVDHVFCIAAKVLQRLPESCERTFQTLDEQYLHDSR